MSITKKILSTPYRWLAPALLYCAIFLATRFIGLTDFTISSDEIRHILRAQATLNGDLLLGLEQSLKQFYVWLVALVMLIVPADHLLAARGVAALSGLLNGLLCYQLGWKLYQKRFIAMLAALFYLISPYALFFDRLALTDSLLTMLMSLSLLLSLYLVERGSWRWAVALGLTFGAALLTKLYGVIYFPAPFLIWLLLERRLSLARLTARVALSYALTIPAWVALIMVGSQAYEDDHYQKVAPTDGTLINSMSHNLAAMLEWFTLYLTWPIVGLLLISLIFALVTRYRPSLLLLMVMGLYLAPFAIFVELLVPRYLFPVIVPMVLLMAWALDEIRVRWLTRLTSQYAPHVAMMLLLMVSLPSLSRDLTIITDPLHIVHPAVDESYFTGQSAHAYREAARYLADFAAKTDSPLTVLRGVTQNNFYHQLTAIASFFVPSESQSRITFETVESFDLNLPQPLFDQHAAENSTLLVTVSEIDSKELLSFSGIELKAADYPQAWRLATFPQPDGAWKIELYQWLTLPDFALRWFQQGGDADPHLLWLPTMPLDHLATSGGVLLDGSPLPWSPDESAEYLLATPALIQHHATTFAPFMTTDGQAIQLQQLPPEWWLAYAYPTIPCQWCLFQLRPPQQPLAVRFEDGIALRGFELSPPHEALEVTLFWESVTTPTQNYQLFIQLLDETGQLAAQHDAPPFAGKIPTTMWQPGTRLADRHTLSLEGVPAGTYRLIVGLYNPMTLERLPVIEGEHGDNAVTLRSITVGERQ